jgi:hypothetical protein
MTTTAAPDLSPDHYQSEERPPLRAVPAEPMPAQSETWSFDPTQGRQVGSHPYDDPTQGRRIGSHPSHDPTQGRQIGSHPYHDPTQGRKVGSDPHEDPTQPR